jgi:DNA-binding MarR family transcriptional regulator
MLTKASPAADDRVGYLLKRAQQALRSRMDRVLERKGLTTPQYSVLSWLERQPGISSAELSRRSFVTPQTMIRIVGNLETLGLIRREPHPTRGRILVASLTREGETAVAACHAEVNAVENQMLHGLTKHERMELRGLLLRCIAAIGEDAARRVVPPFPRPAAVLADPSRKRSARNHAG